MNKLLFLITLVQFLAAYVIDIRDMDGENESDNTEKQIRSELQIRCTRRFSPGICMEEVKPVWTYNFQLQNCTERLGCWQSSVTNRFLSYHGCMMSCQPLVHIYSHILSQDSEINDTQWVPPQQSEYRRGQHISKDDIPKDTPENDRPSELYIVDPPRGREDPDEAALVDVILPDLDYRPHDIVRYDPFHQDVFH